MSAAPGRPQASSHRSAQHEGTPVSQLTTPGRGGEQWTESDGLHIEVRGLEPPQPFVLIIKLVESLTVATPIVVHHNRDPAPLYAELAQRGWSAQHVPGDPGEFRLRLVKDA